jgi:phage gp36-like protein
VSYAPASEVRAAVSPRTGATPNPPTETTHTAADMSNAQLLDALAEADATIDSYIAGRYVTPVALADDGKAPPPVWFWSRNIAAYLATLTQRNSADFTDNDPIARRYNATMLALTAVRDGKAPLPLPADSGSDVGTGAGVGAAVNPYSGQLFTSRDWDLEPDRTALGHEGFFRDGVWHPPDGLW